jgi:hypothetical protein
VIPPGLTDLWAATGALLAVPRGRRAALMAALLDEAETADRFRRLWRRPHPRLGDGSLLAAALARPQAPRRQDDPQALAALALAAALTARHLRRGAVKRPAMDYPDAG